MKKATHQILYTLQDQGTTDNSIIQEELLQQIARTGISM